MNGANAFAHGEDVVAAAQRNLHVFAGNANPAAAASHESFAREVAAQHNGIIARTAFYAGNVSNKILRRQRNFAVRNCHVIQIPRAGQFQKRRRFVNYKFALVGNFSVTDNFAVKIDAAAQSRREQLIFIVEAPASADLLNAV